MFPQGVGYSMTPTCAPLFTVTTMMSHQFNQVARAGYWQAAAEPTCMANDT